MNNVFVVSIAVWSFYTKLAFFTVFVWTLQVDFAARWCFWFSANDSSVEQVCSLLYQLNNSTNLQFLRWLLTFLQYLVVHHWANTGVGK